MQQAQNLIGGRWKAAQDGRTLDVFDPSVGAPFATVARGSATDIDAAISSARHAFDTHWERTPAVERGRHLARMDPRA